MNFLKSVITTFLIVGFLESANAQLLSPEGEPFTYVIQSTYSYDNGSVLTTCNCYSLSRSGYVHGSIVVSRSNTWAQAIASRNNYAGSYNTCPGVCEAPMAVTAPPAAAAAGTRVTINGNWFVFANCSVKPCVIGVGDANYARPGSLEAKQGWKRQSGAFSDDTHAWRRACDLHYSNSFFKSPDIENGVVACASKCPNKECLVQTANGVPTSPGDEPNTLGPGQIPNNPELATSGQCGNFKSDTVVIKGPSSKFQNKYCEQFGYHSSAWGGREIGYVCGGSSGKVNAPKVDYLEVCKNQYGAEVKAVCYNLKPDEEYYLYNPFCVLDKSGNENNEPKTAPPGICRDLKDGDKFYPGYVHCCDSGDNKSRWKGNTGSVSEHMGNCASWGIE